MLGIRSPYPFQQWNIRSASGKVISSSVASGSSLQLDIDVSDLVAGLYIIEVISGVVDRCRSLLRFRSGVLFCLEAGEEVPFILGRNNLHLDDDESLSGRLPKNLSRGRRSKNILSGLSSLTEGVDKEGEEG